MYPPRRGGLPARGYVGREPHAPLRAGNSCAPPGFPLRSINELLQAPARRKQPTLHPEKIDGGLWISIDNEVKYDIKRVFTNDFDGLWWNLGEVPQEQQDKWWSDFVQKYYWDSEHHTLVKTQWTKQLRRMISNNISKGKRLNKKPSFVSVTNWNLMWQYWDSDKAIHISTTNSKNRKSDRGRDGMHQHISGSKSYAKVKYDMMMELGEEPEITDLVQKTHMKIDGIIEEIESIVVSHFPINTDDNEAGSQGSNSPITPLMRDEAFYLIVKAYKGRFFGLGTAQMGYYDPIDPPTIVLPRQARYERDLMNLTGVVNLMSQ
ncbi:unnamed protein product, partial [Thlaspi arvense]